MALPLDEPTLHLTAALATVTGASVLDWICKELSELNPIRNDVPTQADLQTQAMYWELLRSTIRRVIDAPDVIERFQKSRRANLATRNGFSLPWVATPSVLPPHDDFTIRTLFRGNVRVEPDSAEAGIVNISTSGKQYAFPSDAQFLLETIIEGREISADKLYARYASTFSREQIRGLLVDLVDHGLIAYHSSQSAHEEVDLSRVNSINSITAS